MDVFKQESVQTSGFVSTRVFIESNSMSQSIRWWTVAWTSIPLLCITLTTQWLHAQDLGQSTPNSKPITKTEPDMKTEKAILAGGCFWAWKIFFASSLA